MLQNNSEMNVFFVFTPLHVLIAERIIEREDLKKVTVVAFSESGGRTALYCDRILSMHAETINIKLQRDVRSFAALFRIYMLKCKLKSYRLKFYTGSIKSVYSRFFIGAASGDLEINTFDDGYGNLVLDGYFSKDDRLAKKAFLWAVGVRSSYFGTLKKITAHYSLYEHPNVYDDYCKLKKYISLRCPVNAGVKFAVATKGEPIKVLLTQPYSESKILKIERERELYESAIDLLSIDFYIPHPAEIKRKIDPSKTVLLKTEFIAEEVILSLAKNSRVEVYAFGSTALLNLTGAYNVECIWLTANEVSPRPPLNSMARVIDVQRFK